MKKTSAILLPLVALIALLLPSCSGNGSADAGDLLSTVPNDASLVVVINSKSVLEKAGCKVDADKVTLSDQLKALISKKGGDAEKNELETLLGDGTGVDPSVMAFYQVGYYYYLTGYLSDPEKFKTAVAKEKNGSFKTEEGIDICANVAVSNSRFWMNVEQGSIDAREIKHFTALDKSQSFLNNDYAEKLSEFSTDVEGWGNINGILNTAGLPFQERASAQVAIQTLFDDPSALTFSLDFRKGEAAARIGVLNSKGKPAKFQLPTEELDLNTISSLGGTTEALAAVAIPGKLIEKLKKVADSQGPSMLGQVLPIVQCIDGTAAVAYGSQSAVRGVITTNGKDLSGLTSFIGENGINVAKEGNLLKLNKGEVSGAADVAQVSKDFKGAMAGFVIADNSEVGFGRMGVKTAIFTLKPGDGSMRLDITARTGNSNENFLVTLISAQ